MKSKLFGVCVTLVVCTAWWTGCSSDTSSGTGGTPDGGGTPEGGNPTPEGGNPIDDGGGTDAPKDTGVDAALTGPFLPITYGAASCPAFAACGGNVKGSWALTSGCVTEALFAGAKAQCPTIVESNVVIEARGSVVADGVTITRRTDVKFSATLAVPPACVPGGATCAQIGAAIVTLGKLKSANCISDGAAGCTCTVANDVSDNTADAYTTAGNTLTTGAGTTARTYDYCVAANEVSYKETTANALPAIFVLKK